MFAWPPSFFRPRAPKPRVESLDVAHLGQIYPVRLRRNKAAQRLILRVRADTGEAVLTLPSRTTLAHARDFLSRHGGWIASRIARLPDQVAFAPGADIPLQGVIHRIEAGATLRGRVSLYPATGDAPARIVVPGDGPHLARRLTDFLKAEARRALTEAVARHAAALGVTIAGITIKDTRSRWGSCSARGALSFSWRLILAPPHVLDYLAAHEVAHRVEMNHSSRYWATVERIFPGWREAESWLTRHGAGLHRYGPAGRRPTAH